MSALETGMREGDEIPIFYDALLAKLIVWGTDREDARRGLETALTATAIAGVAHNRDFLVRLVQHREFAAGGIDTGFIERHRRRPDGAAVGGAARRGRGRQLSHCCTRSRAPIRRRPWGRGIPARPGAGMTAGGWPARPHYALDWLDAGLERHLEIVFERAGLTLTLDEVAARVKYIARHGSEIELELDSVPLEATVQRQGDRLPGCAQEPAAGSSNISTRSPGAPLPKPVPARLVAPVHGRVLDVLVAPGATVKRGQALMLLECMKLEYRITAPADGTVDALHFAAGDVVEDGVQLLDFTPAAG